MKNLTKTLLLSIVLVITSSIQLLGQDTTIKVPERIVIKILKDLEVKDACLKKQDSLTLLSKSKDTVITKQDTIIKSLKKEKAFYEGLDEINSNLIYQGEIQIASLNKQLKTKKRESTLIKIGLFSSLLYIILHK